MSGQETRVYRLDSAAGRTLAEALSRAGCLFHAAPHAHFQAQGEGVTATWYRSGKLVLQGLGLDGWAARFLGAGAAPVAPGAKAGDAPLPAVLPALGSDEAGKGDTFGPLVVCAVAVQPGDADRLQELQVADSKRMSDLRVATVAAALREGLAWEERSLEPEEYNRRHAAAGRNVNRLLAAVHTEVLVALWRRTGVRRAVVDRFAASAPVTAALRERGAVLEVLETPRAERHPAVAAASVLARSRFLEELRRLQDLAAADLPPGSGEPVVAALRRLVAIHGAEGLGRFAKLHFRTVQGVARRLPGL